MENLRFAKEDYFHILHFYWLLFLYFYTGYSAHWYFLPSTTSRCQTHYTCTNTDYRIYEMNKRLQERSEVMFCCIL